MIVARRDGFLYPAMPFLVVLCLTYDEFQAFCCCALLQTGDVDAFGQARGADGTAFGPMPMSFVPPSPTFEWSFRCR